MSDTNYAFTIDDSDEVAPDKRRTSWAHERRAVRDYLRRKKLPTFACTECGKFAFSKPTTCFWCRHD